MTETKTPSNFLTTKQLAQRWGVSVAMIASARKAGHGPKFINVQLNPTKRPIVRYNIKDIEAFENSDQGAFFKPEVVEVATS